MKIVHVLAYYGNYYGGIQHVVNQISKRQASLGHHVTIITSNKFSKSTMVENVSVQRLRTPFIAFRVPFMPEMPFKLLSEECDVLSVFLPFPSLDLFAALRKTCRPKTKLIVSIRNPLPDPINLTGLMASNIHDKFTIKAALRCCDAVLFTTNEFPQSLPYDIPINKTFIVPNGIDTDLFCPTSDYSFDRNQILFVGRLIPEKALDILARSMKMVRREFPEMKLIAVGSDYYSQSDYKKRVLQLGEGFLELRSDVPTPELAKLYRNSALFVLPSIGLESYGNVLMEAIASGCPVVSTDLPGPKSLVMSGSHVPIGSVVPKGTADKLGAAIIHELKNNTKERRRKIREYTESKASWDSVVRQLIEIYKKCGA